ncbi:MAG: PRC-barrel domain-containing protein [Caldilineaceae bacterium]
MNLPKSSMRFLAVLLVMVLVLSACAIQEPEVVVAPETVDEGVIGDSGVVGDGVVDETVAPIAGVGNAANVLVTASSLIDYSFENIDGQVSGEIEDLIIDLSTGNVPYVTVEYGGFLDIGDTELPMPLSAFSWGPDGQLILAFDEATLESFPDLGTDWPDLTTGTWDDEVNTFWRGAGIEPGVDFNQATDTVVRASNTIGYGVSDVGLGIGTVDDMLIDLGQSQVQYVLVGGYDPTIYGNDLIAVPFDAFDATALGSQLTLAQGVDASVLENAPRFTRDSYVTGDSQVFGDIDNYWTGLGYGAGVAGIGATDNPLEQGTGVLEDQGLGTTTGVVGISGAEGYLVRASTLLDYNVSNLNGDNIGEIEDMLIDVETGNILFATLEYGGFLDIGDSEVAVPMSAFNWGSENELILNVAEDQLEALPDVGADWPNVTDATWNDEIVNFWENEGINTGFASADTQTVMYASNLIGYSLSDVGFGAEGSVYDILVNPSQSNAPYAIVDYGGLFDSNLAAIPFSAFDVGVADGGFSFTPNIGLDTLQGAPVIERNSFDQTGLYDADFDSEINTYWEDAGYDVGVGNTVVD